MKEIVLADDDANDRFFFKEALKEVTVATRLTTANDGVELMAALEETVVTIPPPPHLIFLDLNMPRKNGFECLQEIRETPRLKSIPIVILSTTANESALDRTYSLGANHYMVKPILPEDLVKAIETVLSLNLWETNQQPARAHFFIPI